MEVLLMTTASLLEVEMGTTSASSATAEKVREDVIEIHVVELLSASLTIALLVLSNTLFSLLVVDSALLLI